jgi:hypothetical protein
MGCIYHANEADLELEEEMCPQQWKRIERTIGEKDDLWSKRCIIVFGLALATE